ncbi:MAG TPA: 50S ribosomal protein L6 [Candidatus Peribacteraceae bacterium]|nr:50S ribosomal protein L6 [Candidatus Peribacteraceae bacterium]
MSRIGKKSVAFPSGVTVEVKPSTAPASGGTVSVKGPKGSLSYAYLPEITVKVEGNQVFVDRKGDEDKHRALHGLTRQLIANMVQGVHQGYEKRLEIIGVGYKAQVKGKMLTLHLGFSHPINFTLPDGIEILQEEQNKNVLIVRGIDKQLVGQVASNIRGYRPPEPYKGKGIRYVDEFVRRKPGKAAAAKTSAA